MELMALGCLHMGQVVMDLIIILAELERASHFAEASQLYSDLKFYFVLQICWVWVKGYLSKRSILFIKMINKLHQLPPNPSLTSTQSVFEVFRIKTQSFYNWKRNVRMCMESSVHCTTWIMHFRHIFYSCDWLSLDWARISLSTISKTREISHTLQQSSGHKFIKGKHASFFGGYKLTLRLKITVVFFGSCTLRMNLKTLQLPPFI